VVMSVGIKVGVGGVASGSEVALIHI